MHFTTFKILNIKYKENRKGAKHNKTSKEEIKKAFSKQENLIKR